MIEAHQERPHATELPAESVISILLEQHARIRWLFAQSSSADEETRRDSFDALRELLAVHEAAEEIVVRPVSKHCSDGAMADARNEEEKHVASALAELEKLDVTTFEFTEGLAAFERDVFAHAAAEETEEFPYILTRIDPETQLQMGARLLALQRSAPMAVASRAASKTAGSFALLLERARTAFRPLGEGAMPAVPADQLS